MVPKYNDALIIYEDARAKDALVYLQAFIQQVRNAGYGDTESHLAALLDSQWAQLQHLATEGQENPKLQELKFILDEEYHNNDQTRTVLFVRTRALTDALKNWIEETDSLNFLKPGILIGRGRKSHLTGSGMTLTSQKGVLDSFKSSDQSKILIATSVADEGIDIPQCNLVIMYEYVGNVVKMVQVRGRGRAQGSRCFLISSSKERIDKEKLNMQREEVVEKAIASLQSSPEDLRAKVTPTPHPSTSAPRSRPPHTRAPPRQRHAHPTPEHLRANVTPTPQPPHPTPEHLRANVTPTPHPSTSAPTSRPPHTRAPPRQGHAHPTPEHLRANVTPTPHPSTSAPTSRPPTPHPSTSAPTSRPPHTRAPPRQRHAHPTPEHLRANVTPTHTRAPPHQRHTHPTPEHLLAKVDVFQREEKARRAHVSAEPERPHDMGSYQLLCAKCRHFACFSSDLRVLQEAHHIILDRSVFNRCETKPHGKPKTFDGITKTKKLLCGNCKMDWGIIASYLNIQNLPVVKIESFVIQNIKTQQIAYFRKWKDVTFALRTFDLAEMSAERWGP
ncbi:hypothetical protein P4O66_020743 [Electrophorus voltai]|uniref:RNA helicase n=1 Tax=Electrophorus voltai TaxID=2609070 RepID=A0AAD9E3Y0_9TELE|nr:hypothetical protein P4O66_020743 [Electrophorus voltai]